MRDRGRTNGPDRVCEFRLSTVQLFPCDRRPLERFAGVEHFVQLSSWRVVDDVGRLRCRMGLVAIISGAEGIERLGDHGHVARLEPRVAQMVHVLG
jgi:hypothetical protein